MTIRLINSIYTRYLLQYVDQKGLPIIEAQNSSAIKVLQATNNAQRPSIGGQYIGRVYLAPSTETLEQERQLWQDVLVADASDDDVRNYIMLLPGSGMWWLHESC